MEPTLQHRDRLFVHKFLYTPQNGDIVVFDPTGGRSTKYIKRVIATEGQTVYINFANNSVYVDNELIYEPYILESMNILRDNQPSFGPMLVPEGTSFVLGDNRNNSHDSRAIGAVDNRRIEGRAVLRFFPPRTFGTLR